MQHSREVYPRRAMHVNRSDGTERRSALAGRLVVVGLLAGAWSAVGCRAARDPGFYPIGLSYRFPVSDDGSTVSLAARAGRDFGTIQRLGFNTVFLESPGNRIPPGVRTLANRAGLRLLVPDADARTYVRTGRLPPGYLSLEWLAYHTQRVDAEMIDVGEVTDEASARRLRSLTDLHHGWGNRREPLTFATFAPSAAGEYGETGVSLYASSVAPVDRVDEDAKGRRPARGIARLDLSQPVSSRDAEAEHWLRAYHESLVSGCTAGLTCGPFRATTPDRVGIVGSRDVISTKRAALIKQITRRARKWGPLLRGTTPRRLERSAANEEPIATVLFVGKKRRYVMVLNRSDHEFVRGAVTISGCFENPPADRLVAIPTDDRIVIGEVTRVRRGGVTLDTDLAPGDARLYEFF